MPLSQIYYCCSVIFTVAICLEIMQAFSAPMYAKGNLSSEGQSPTELEAINKVYLFITANNGCTLGEEGSSVSNTFYRTQSGGLICIMAILFPLCFLWIEHSAYFVSDCQITCTFLLSFSSILVLVNKKMFSTGLQDLLLSKWHFCYHVTINGVHLKGMEMNVLIRHWFQFTKWVNLMYLMYSNTGILI